MKTGKQHISQKAAIIFLGIMLFFTFFSRTIHYIMTPKVIAQRPENGYISNTYSYRGEEISIVYDNLVEIGIAHKLEQPLEISSINVEEGNRVSAGDELVSFNIAPFEKSITDFESQLDNYEIELKEFDRNFNERISGLKKEIEDYKGQIKQIDWDINSNSLSGTYLDAMQKRNNLSFNLDKAEQSLEYMESSGILSGKTRDGILSKIDTAKDEIDKKRLYIEKYQKIVSEVDGIVSGVHYLQYDIYSGIKPLITVIPDDTSRSLKVKTSKMILDILQNDTANTYYINDDIEVEAEIIKTEVVEKDCFLYLVLKGETTEYGNIKSLRMEINTKSEYCDILIPNSAFFSPQSIYVLKERDGFWGKEYYVESYEVLVGEYNNMKSAIISGLRRGDMVVTGWDRELTDGQRVFLPLN